MKYLKTFESKDIDKTYIEDLFGDLKDICNFSSWNGGENDELLVTNIRLPEMPIMRINAPDDFGPSIAPNRINKEYYYLHLKKLFDQRLFYFSLTLYFLISIFLVRKFIILE